MKRQETIKEDYRGEENKWRGGGGVGTGYKG